MYDIELLADHHEAAQAAARECAALEALAPTVTRIRAAGHDFGKLVRIWCTSGYGDVTRTQAHTLRVTADARLYVDGQDLTLDAPYWLEQLSSAHTREVIAPAGRVAPALVEQREPVTLTNPAQPQGFKVNLTWLRADPARLRSRRGSHIGGRA